MTLNRGLFFSFTVLTVFLIGCRSYYQRNLQFNNYIEMGEFEKAEKELLSDKKAEKRKTKLLYYMNLGVANSMQGKYKESNDYFEKAYVTIEDFIVNPLDIAASFLTNPNMVEYRGEDFERFLIHYYKALNFLKLNDREAALVECKRMDIKMKQLGDKYKSDNKYNKDAFIHLLMGLIYDANFDYNNAFIAYRNALEIYKNDYKKLFNASVPEQLKNDLLRTAYLNGFLTELQAYEKEFGIVYSHQKSEGDLIFFWQNGLGPFKEEWGINFIIVRGEGGLVFFRNEELGLNFSFPMSDDEYKSKGLSDIEFIKVAFPKYVERRPLFSTASLTSNHDKVNFELVENVNAIAFKCLQQRMLEELGKSLLRVALKKAAEYQLRKKDDALGAALGALNALSEKADTRNWQTLPHGIYYTRISLKAGMNEIKFSAAGGNKTDTAREQLFKFEVTRPETVFHSYQTLQSMPSNSLRY